MKIEKPEKLVGYILLIIGVIIILIPVLISTLILLGSMGIPIYVQKPVVHDVVPPDPAIELAKIMAEAFPLLNIVPSFLLFVALIYAGSVLMGKGTGLIKEITWKVEKVAKREAEEETTKLELKPTKRTKAEKHEENE